MAERTPVVVLVDVDQTLIDNKRAELDFTLELNRACGPDAAVRYWMLFEEMRRERGYANYLSALEHYRLETRYDYNLIQVATYMLDYPFATRLYPHALDVVEHLYTWGTPVIISDGDIVFQPHKIARSGLSDAVGGRVLITIHKEQELDTIAHYYPADHYILIDDKPGILGAIKRQWGKHVTTILPKQGDYANDPGELSRFPNPDMSIDNIAELLRYDRSAMLKYGTTPVSAEWHATGRNT